MRKGYTLVEALTSIFVLAIGLLALTVFIIGGIMDINRTIRVISAQQSSDNAASLMKIVGPSLITSIPSNSFLWIYQPGKSPPVPAGSNVRYNPPDPRLSLSLDVQGPYERLQVPGDARPFYTGLRANPHDPEIYTYAISVRPLDGTLVDVSVVIFEGYYDDPSDPEAPIAYVLDNAALDYQAIALRPLDPTRPITAPRLRRVPTRAIIVDGENGYVYRLVQGEVIPPGRALPTSQNQNQNQKIIVLERAVEVLELGIISVR